MTKREYLDRILEAWEKCPEYSFCEFLDAALERKDVTFICEIADDEILFELENFANTEKIPHTIEIKGSFSAVKTIDARDELEAENKMFDVVSDSLSGIGLDMEDYSAGVYRGDE